MRLAAMTRTGCILSFIIFTLITLAGKAAPPQVNKPYKRTSNAPNLQQTLPSNDEWWKLFRDPILDTLIDKAVIKNYDVRNAIRKIELAKDKLRVDRSPYYPTIYF